MPVKLRAAKGRRPSFSGEVLALFVELERKRTQAFTDGSRELARRLGLTAEWWTGNHVNDRSAEPCHPPSCVAHQDWFRCRGVRNELLAAVRKRPGAQSE
jgi:hypothetical protein